VANHRQQRQVARLAAVQALFQIEANGQVATSVIHEFMEFRLNQARSDEEGPGADIALFSLIVSSVDREVCELDTKIEGVLAVGWTVPRLDPTSRALLRAACFELEGGSVPARVIIKEYVDIAGGFGGKEETAFVNAALDTLARKFRQGEMNESVEVGS
tara:strand:+ start:1650 stop:2126 length:477 start_codon:yes stop_codon:yes gene_type:complete